VQRIYLDELGALNQQTMGINLMQLTIASDQEMAEQARQLIERVECTQTTRLAKNEIIEIITTIAVYKFSQLSREEVETMLGLSLEQTRIYQEAKAEGRVEGRVEGRTEGRAEGRVEGRVEGRTEMLKLTVPLLLKAGLSIEEIAQQLNVELEVVRSAAQ
jgi:predicted transposase/invertase (TIGR01784 family)